MGSISPDYIILRSFFDNLKDSVEKKLEEAMPWVGVYIAAASAVCTLAMAADAFNGFRSKRLWFPSKYFSLNAISLTLLAVAMKLPIDLNTNMYKSRADWLAKYTGLLFMSTAMANFMSSLGSMSDKEVQANVVALVILVITVSANVLIQLFLLWNDYLDIISIFIFMIPIFVMLRLLVKLVSIAIMVPTIKRRLEAKYQEQHKIVLLREEGVLNRRPDGFRIEDLRRGMMKYWLMAETSNPQFVMARSLVCNTSICFLFALTFVATYILFFLIDSSDSIMLTDSSYKSSTIWILVIQTIGVGVGTIAPTLRWFAALSFKCSNLKSFKRGFKIETYWTQILVECRESFSGYQIRRGKFRKCLHDAKWFAVTLCIGLQILTLLLGKLFVVLSVLITAPFFLCFILIKKIVNRLISTKAEESVDDTNLNQLNRYVLLLEGEPELPPRILKIMCHEANNMIQTGRKKQPKSLVLLLGKFVNFNGVAQFDSDHRIPSLHFKEPPNCWTLPVVTLTTIAIALPNSAKHKHKRLLSSVGEGLSLAMIVEKTLYEAELENIRKAANICWARVLLYMKWQDMNLSKTSLKCKSSKEVLQVLSNKAEGVIMEFKKEEKDPIMENPLNWPTNVVAANSMYRITRTVMLSCDDESNPTDEGLFERLCVMIADILAACLTNLPHVIATMCHRNAIEKREKSVHGAFRLLGETEDVIDLLQKQKWPHLDNDKAAYIEDWRALFLQNDDVAASNEIKTASMSSEEHLAITVDR